MFNKWPTREKPEPLSVPTSINDVWSWISARLIVRRAQHPSIQRHWWLESGRLRHWRWLLVSSHTCCSVAWSNYRMARKTDDEALWQGPRIYQRNTDRTGKKAQHPDPFYSTRKTATQCVYRALQQNRSLWLACQLSVWITQWSPGICHKRLWTSNHERPNMMLGGITPKKKLALAA